MSAEGAAVTPQGGPVEEMRQRWAPEWWIWRSRDGLGDLNCWCATRRGEGRELSMTLMEPTAGALEKALTLQSERPLFHD